MPDYEVRHVLDIKAGLGEGPLWSVEQQALVWLDIHGETINWFDPVTGTNQPFKVPAKPGCLALREGGAFIASTGGILDFDFATGQFEHKVAAPFGENYRFNDGKPDRQGRFWAGSMKEMHGADSAYKGTYYRYEKGELFAGLPGITVPNGTAFSPDGKTMYRAESMERVIYAYDYDIVAGMPSNQREFARMPDNIGIPDGATVDTEGGYWSALPFGEVGMVGRFLPDGTLDFTIEMPVLVVTMVAFGGPDMSTLYATTGRIESVLNREPSLLGGDIFAIETNFKGIPETLVPR
jgi:sugar lactone lactonase YvrE